MLETTSEQHPEHRSANGRLSQLVGQENQFLLETYRSFEEAWAEHDLPRAALAFAWFREAQEKHMRWEEESLFEEFEKRCTESELRQVRAHHFKHEAISNVARRSDLRPPAAGGRSDLLSAGCRARNPDAQRDRDRAPRARAALGRAAGGRADPGSVQGASLIRARWSATRSDDHG
jgi:hypothetical protein